MMRFFLIIILVAAVRDIHAQYFQFTQYDLTPQRVNPAMIANSDFASLRLLYRNQATAAGFHLTSNNIDASYPLINKQGKRWSGVGISFMDDRSGYAGIYNTQEFGLSYAANVNLRRDQTLSLGLKSVYQKRRIDIDGLYTGAQYVEDRGFNPGLYNGENTGGILRNSYLTFSAGMYWQKEDNNGERLMYAGFSFFDFNEPDEAFLGTASELKSSYSGFFGFEAWRKNKIRLLPEVLVSGGRARTVVNGGLVTRFQAQKDQHFDIITRYRLGRSGIVGFVMQRKKASVGFTYDFPVGSNTMANTGAFEIGVQLRELVFRRQKNVLSPGPFIKKNREHKVGMVKPTSLADTIRFVGARNTTTRSSSEKEVNKLSERLKQKQDSLVRSGFAGDVKHEPLVLEKATLYFNFDFGSTDLNEEATRYFDNLAGALIDNPALKIKLVGHTDNVGSDRFNLKLSLERARSIKEYLIKKGVAPERILDEGKGMREPLNKNLTGEDRAKNRRVEMTILY